MNIFEFAMEKEKLSKQYYRELAGRTSNKGLAHIFDMLADQEAKHYEIISKMREDTPPEVSETTLLADAKAVFVKMREAVDKFNLNISELELYKKAQEIEKQARSFYLEKAEETADETQRNIFLMLANEEKKHYFLLDNIIDFASRPEMWLENAEFVHLEEY